MFIHSKRNRNSNTKLKSKRKILSFCWFKISIFFFFFCCCCCSLKWIRNLCHDLSLSAASLRKSCQFICICVFVYAVFRWLLELRNVHSLLLSWKDMQKLVIVMILNRSSVFFFCCLRCKILSFSSSSISSFNQNSQWNFHLIQFFPQTKTLFLYLLPNAFTVT